MARINTILVSCFAALLLPTTALARITRTIDTIPDETTPAIAATTAPVTTPTLSTTRRSTTTTSSSAVDWCYAGGFINQINGGAQFCCPGRLIQNTADTTGYACCVGNYAPTSTAVSALTSPSGTISEFFYATPTSCSATVQVTDSAYSSSISSAATRYSITYASSGTIYTVGRAQGSQTSTGGVVAMTKAPIAGAALAMVGGLLMAV